MPVAHLIIDATHATTICWKTFLNSDGKTLARIHYRQWRGVTPPRTHLFPIFLTPFNDGTFLVSSGGKPDMLAPECVEVHHRRNVRVESLWDFHEQQLGETFGATGVLMRRPAHISEMCERYHAAVRDFHLDRGVFGEPIEQEIELPPLPKKVERPRKSRTSVNTAAEPESFPDDELEIIEEPFGDDDLEIIEESSDEDAVRANAALPERYAEVTAHLKQQQTQSSWKTAIVVLVVTALLYIGLGAAQWDWKYVAILVPALLFHELGHLLAMWAFGYRNLKMFFIPFFGAAVSGRHHNVAGWKKALVALAGPVPGIGVGCVVGMTGAVIENELLIEIGLVTLLLNVFNLLPLMPLDGGWNLHAILFTRHPLLDAGFRGLAAVGCLGLATALDAKGLIYTGIWMLIGIAPAYRCGKIAARLRQEGVEFEPTDDGSIPPEAVALIVEELQESSKTVDHKTLATLTINVYETLNSKPPGWLATLSLLAMHVGSFVIAVVFLCVLFVSKQGGLWNVARLSADAPEHSFSCGSLDSWRGQAFDAERQTPHNTIVVTLSDDAVAMQLFLQLRGQLPGTAAVKRMSRLLFVSIPDDNNVRQQWLTKMEQHDPQAFVLTSDQGSFTEISFLAPSEEAAQQLEQELLEYTSVAAMHAIPPWQTNDPRNLAEREQHRKARRTYQRLLKVNNEPIDDPELKDIQKQQADAGRRRDNEKIQQLLKQTVELRLKHQRARIEQLKNARDPELDADTIDAFLQNQVAFEPFDGKLTEEQIKQRQAEHQRRQLALGKPLGQLPIAEGKPIRGSDRYAANYGFAQRAGMLVRMTVHYRDLFDGLPTTVEWLCGRGCIDLKFNAKSFGEDED